jgi:hypothetical protein
MILIIVTSALKKSLDDGMTILLKEMSSLQQTISSQQSALTRLTEQHTSLHDDLSTHRNETIRKIENITLKSPPPSSLSPTKPTALKPHLSTLKSLKIDLLALKTEHNSFVRNIATSITAILSLPFTSTVQIVTGDDLATQKASLEAQTQSLVSQSDDLSDLVDDLRIDITQKRIRPHPRAITAVRKAEAHAKSSLVAVETLLKTVKPVWKRKWEDELQQVIDGQEFLRHQETLITDLRKDLSDTEMVIEHVVQAAELFESRALAPREWLGGALGSGGRDALLGEVKTLMPNSEERVEAIARAEKARAREMELRRENEFQVELGEFVTQDKLKGAADGASRIEKEREEKERKIRQELWEKEKARQMQQQQQALQSGALVASDTPGAVEKLAVEGGIKRAVSEGRSPVTPVEDVDGVTRSISHSSGLSRMKRISTAKRFSGDTKGGSTSNSGRVDEAEEGEMSDDSGVGEG